MQGARPAFSPPPLTPFVKQLLIGLFAAYVAQLIVDSWLGIPVASLLAMQPGALMPWQLVTYVVIEPQNPIWFLIGLLFLWWILSPFEGMMGRTRTWQLAVTVTLAGSLPAWIFGFAMPDSPALFGTGPVWFGAMGATLWLYRGRQMSLFGLGSMNAQQFIGLMLGLSVLMFLFSHNHTHFIADLGALAGGIGFVRYMRRPPGRSGGKRRKPKRGSRGSGLRVIEGGRDEDGPPKWLN